MQVQILHGKCRTPVYLGEDIVYSPIKISGNRGYKGDKAKGIIAKPMPKEWYDRASNRITDGLNEQEIKHRLFNLRILADKKPYFMRYIYPNLMNQYNTYIKNTETKCVREFRLTVNELLEKDKSTYTQTESDFIEYYYQRMPVGLHPCVMNKICKRFEEEFDNYFLKNTSDEEFDYSIMKSGREYTAGQYNAISKLYDQYIKRVQDYMRFSKQGRVDEDEVASARSMMVRDFKTECFKACSNGSQLCDIILDLCYKRSGTKQFCWDICGEEIIDNLLAHNNNILHYPIRDENGDIEFDGKRFSMQSKEV